MAVVQKAELGNDLVAAALVATLQDDVFRLAFPKAGFDFKRNLALLYDFIRLPCDRGLLRVPLFADPLNLPD